MASVLQVMFALPDVQKKYLTPGAQHIANCSNNPAQCYQCQMAKLADGLLSGRYSRPPQKKDDGTEDDGQEGIPPRMLKSLICKDHPEFSTMRQQVTNYIETCLTVYRTR
jgi:ubiquitin carboxyl-terminal hydrolase 5/13